MFAQQMFSPQPTDPMQAKVMRFLPIIFTLFMLFFPAGLVLYWTVNNLFTMAQQYIVNKNHIRYVNRSRYIILQAGGREVRLDKINSHIINDFMK